MKTENLNAKEYNPYYQPYINKTADSNIIKGLRQNLESVLAFYESIPQNKLGFAYAPEKWTVKDVLLHCIDTERIFSYRALRIARQDFTPIEGFEQDDYVLSAKANSRTIVSLLNEYKIVRQSTIEMYNHFSSDALSQIGVASGFPISVRALGYIITGHENHHIQVIKERYL